MTDETNQTGDRNRIARDYAVVRMEHMEASDLQGYSLQDIRDIEESFHSAQISLLSSLCKADRTGELLVSRDFEMKVKVVKCRLSLILKEDQKPVSVSESGNLGTSCRLPKITIKPFNGDINNWVSFIQLFDSLIHNKSIPLVEKLHYLLTSVQGDALDLIKNFPICDENYLIAYNTLKRNYDKKHIITMTYYDKLLKCEPIKSKSFSELNRVHRTFTENLAILERYCLPDKNFMLFHLLWSKLDKSTREDFLLEHDSDDIPRYEDVHEFIEKHYRALEMSSIQPYSTNMSSQSNNKPKGQNKPKSSLLVSSSGCVFCSGQHGEADCPEFLKLEPRARFQLVKDKGLCISCLSDSHRVKKCTLPPGCSKCGFSHHTLLHFDKRSEENSSQGNSLDSQTSTVLTSMTNTGTALFSTARVLIMDSSGKYQPVRALLDSASACNFISETCVRRLGLKVGNSQQAVLGIGHSSTKPTGLLHCNIKTSDLKSNFEFDALVLPSICADQPTQTIDVSGWSHIRELPLADPDFATPGPVELLLSVEVVASSLLPGLRTGEPNQPKALCTVFGWILLGGCESSSSHSCSHRFRKNECFFVSKNESSDFSLSNTCLDDSLKKFWELEHVIKNKTFLSEEEQRCENYFVDNYRRNDEGRFIVPLPFVDPVEKPIFSNSREIALKRFLSSERKIRLNPDFHQAYVAFMQDYEVCGHLEEVEPPASNVGKFYYIPHHGVLRPDSVSTPLRVVFDASAKDRTGTSLNTTLLSGPKLQTNIFDLLLRFRWHAVVFTGDVKQMYRQILVPEEDSDYQRILWRPSPVGPVRDYRLRTVTYGVSSAPYQALRTMAQLAQDSASEFPSGSAVLSRDIYVDDVVSGADSVEEALLLREELTKILSSGGFHLRKWTSNNSEFLADLPASELYSKDFKDFEDRSDVSLKVLGLLWQPRSDSFQFKVENNEKRRCTKRTILSDIARIYDPLGFLGPLTFLAKYFMQLLWTSGVSWDDDVPEPVASEWARFKSELSTLASIEIPRRLVLPFVVLQLHGFCDASERGYCAVIYCRYTDAEGNNHVAFCCAKSRVAPLRKLSIPRLELQAAVLLSDLMQSAVEALKPFHTVNEIVAWSDSTVALSWIRSCPSRWKTFVANRVSHIQEIIAPDCWHHVNSTSNPADCGSRGMLPSELVSYNLWWNGPSWLREPQNCWPALPLPVQNGVGEEEQRIFSLFSAADVNCIDTMWEKFSRLPMLKRVLSYCLRFLRNTRPSGEKIIGPLQPSELEEAFSLLIRHAQQKAFSQEIDNLKKGSPNSLPKCLRKLSPFIDDVGVLRVGGRLAHANVDFQVKHPILLPRSHRLTVLIIDEYHRKFMHPGAQTLQNLIAQYFWILSPKRAIRQVISGCLQCFRANPRPAPAPVMGNLPPFRVSQIKPFSTSVVDYGGPFNIALGRGRGIKTFKGYIAVFVCTSTKAIHIELASELSTDAFLAVLKRFIARRGRCSNLISDQGRNFVGASNYLGTLMQSAADAQEIKFLFSPPGSPHFNGLAEAGIKSVKTHLSRVIGNQRLTFEEFYTVLTQIEAMLNSRPLTPLSSDANDLEPLTPGHFLTMEPLTMLPEENLVDARVGPLQRWKLIQQIHQCIWQRWHREYIHTLQQRMKWNKSHANIVEGTLVLIVQENASPLNWVLGRIIALHPGADGVCRVVTVRTAAGQYKRPVVKLCPLPTSDI